MKLTQEAIKEFQVIYQKDYGIKLKDELASELAVSFFNMMKVVYKPIPKKYFGKNKKQPRGL